MDNIEKQLDSLRVEYEKARALCKELADAYDGDDTQRVIDATLSIYYYIYPRPIGVSATEKVSTVSKFGG